jgi:uncharacterized protein YkwD
VEISERELPMDKGGTYALNYAVLPPDAADKDLTWESSDPSVVLVTDGRILAVSAGTATVTALSANGKSAQCAVTVTVSVKQIVITLSKRVAKVGDICELDVAIQPEDATDKAFALSVTGGEVYGGVAILCAAGGTVTVTAAAANGVTAERSITVIDLQAYAEEVLRLTNAERRAAGLPDFGTSGALSAAAFTRAREITEYFSHDRPDGRSCFTSYDEENISYRAAGENIAYGQSTPQEVVSGWMDSPGHRSNILSSDFSQLGVGVELSEDGALYWSQNFMG